MRSPLAQLNRSPQVSRRHVLHAASAALGLAAIDAVLLEPVWLDVTHHTVPVPDLPSSLRGFRIAQLSDLHLSSIGSVERAVTEALRAYQPNIIAITGDSIDSAAAIGTLQSWLAELPKEALTLAICGNWEHWGSVPLDDFKRALQSVRVRLLANENAVVGGVVVVSTDDSCSGHAQPELAWRNLPGNPVRLFLTHAPGLFDLLPRDAPKFSLSLAGHTHGGQVRVGAAIVRPPGSGSFSQGWYDTTVGRLYVNRGLGTSVLPARFLCRPELALFELAQG